MRCIAAKLGERGVVTRVPGSHAEADGALARVVTGALDRLDRKLGAVHQTAIVDEFGYKIGGDGKGAMVEVAVHPAVRGAIARGPIAAKKIDERDSGDGSVSEDTPGQLLSDEADPGREALGNRGDLLGPIAETGAKEMQNARMTAQIANTLCLALK
jgi:hypothetical protein